MVIVLINERNVKTGIVSELFCKIHSSEPASDDNYLFYELFHVLIVKYDRVCIINDLKIKAERLLCHGGLFPFANLLSPHGIV